MSAVTSRIAVAPLERCKMETLLNPQHGSSIRAAQSIIAQDGIKGFWRGTHLNVMRSAPFKAVNFFAFEVYHQALTRVVGEVNNTVRFAAGASAGVTACLTCFPLDTIRTRMLAPGAQHNQSAVRTLRVMLKQQGVGSLYVGVLPSILSMGPAGAVFYGVYDILKERHLARLPPTPSGGLQQQLPAHSTLLYGAISGATADLVVYPLEVVKRKLQLASLQEGAAAVGAGRQVRLGGLKSIRAMHSITTDLWQSRGVAGFYTGILPNMMMVLPSAAISYYTYETLKAALLKADS